MGTRETIIEWNIQRIMKHVEKTDSCWIWNGGRTVKGYGMISIGGKGRLAHRAIYELLVGDIPEGLVLDHLCCVKECVNPDHLEPVTITENVLRGHRERGGETGTCIYGHPLEPRKDGLRVRNYCKVCGALREAERRERVRDYQEAKLHSLD